jgi:hypothetical protein
MSFDLSRIRFNARRDFLGVVMQQGRVQLDADWNEWLAQVARRLQAGTLDTLGGNAVPRITPDGFRIEANAGALTIGPGRIYVDGVLAENHGAGPDGWEPRLAVPSASLPLDYSAQPYYPNPPPLPLPDGGPHLAYVDVWQREVTAVELPDLVEKAVGVDTTGRLQTVWQVKLLADVGDISCATDDQDIPGWPDVIAPSAGRLSTATGVPDYEPDPCQVPPAAGYRGLENQLYRVEVHSPGALGKATFKWSRDNATVASRVSHINPARDRITVQSIGRDDVLRFHNGDWVEVTDDWLELHNLPGELRRIRVAGGVDETARTLELDVALSPALFPTDAQQATDPARNTRVRRWDQSGVIHREDGSAAQDLNDPLATGEITIPAPGTRLFLENGILVAFDLAPSGGLFHSGDHWVFAARSVDASIELLTQAPPLGIHHHYARLAVVAFPDDETDCRTLWPPVAEGEGCDCSVCVSAEGHNSGAATLQQAIDSIKGGGTVCLGIGTYNIDTALNIDGARSLRIRGQGWATLLVGSKPGGMIEIEASTGVALENFTIIGSAVSGTAMIGVSNTVDFRAEHLNVLGMAAENGTSVGIGLSGVVLGASIGDCAIVAERGIATTPVRDRKYLLTGELRVADNLFYCSQHALILDSISLHYGNTRIAGNLMLNGAQAALVAAGGVLPGSSFSISENEVYTSGDGIRAAVDGLRIENNDLTGTGERSGDGIVLEEGLDPIALDDVRISGNRLTGFKGNGILITHRLESARITDNALHNLGLGALIMGAGGSAGQLTFSGNHCRNLGLAANSEGTAFAAVQLIRVERGDVCENLIAEVALGAIASPGVDGLRAMAVGQLRITGNRLFAIGPGRSSASIAAIHIVPPFDRVVIDDNFIDRVGDQAQPGTAPSVWRAILIAPRQEAVQGQFTPAHFFTGAEAAYLLTANGIYALALPPSGVSIQNNQLRAQLTRVPLNLCNGLDHILFAANHCETVGAPSDFVQLGELHARTLNVSNNRLVSAQNLHALYLYPQIERAIVIGNTSTGEIRVLSGATVPPDIELTNIIGA